MLLKIHLPGLSGVIDPKRSFFFLTPVFHRAGWGDRPTDHHPVDREDLWTSPHNAWRESGGGDRRESESEGNFAPTKPCHASGYPPGTMTRFFYRGLKSRSSIHIGLDVKVPSLVRYVIPRLRHPQPPHLFLGYSNIPDPVSFHLFTGDLHSNSNRITDAHLAPARRSS